MYGFWQVFERSDFWEKKKSRKKPLPKMGTVGYCFMHNRRWKTRKDNTPKSVWVETLTMQVEWCASSKRACARILQLMKFFWLSARLFWFFLTKNLILVQTERWRRGWDMQVERKEEQSSFSGERVSNVWAIYLLPWNNGWKRSLIPNEVEMRHLNSINVGDPERGLAVGEELLWYQLVGEVMAHQG